MVRFTSLVVAATTFLAVASPPTGATGSPLTTASVTASVTAATPIDAWSFVVSFDRLEFNTSISAFVGVRATASPTWHDWSTDGCSTPGSVGLGDTGRSFNFRSACWRHDFGYRNSKRADSWFGPAGRYWNSTTRLRIDRQLLADMKVDCAPRSWTERYSCLGWAETYYRAVRAFGGI